MSITVDFVDISEYITVDISEYKYVGIGLNMLLFAAYGGLFFSCSCCFTAT